MQTTLPIWLTSDIGYFNIKYFQSTAKYSHYFIPVESHCSFRNIRAKNYVNSGEEHWKLKAKEIIPFFGPGESM